MLWRFFIRLEILYTSVKLYTPVQKHLAFIRACVYARIYTNIFQPNCLNCYATKYSSFNSIKNVKTGFIDFQYIMLRFSRTVRKLCSILHPQKEWNEKYIVSNGKVIPSKRHTEKSYHLIYRTICPFDNRNIY